jgi:hypothetical protein
MTQKEAVLEVLRMGPVCSFDFYGRLAGAGVTHRLAARVYDLRSDGHEITSRRCTFHDHVSNAVLYELVGADVGQLELAL